MHDVSVNVPVEYIAPPYEPSIRVVNKPKPQLEHRAQHSQTERCRIIIIPRSHRHRPHRRSSTVHAATASRWLLLLAHPPCLSPVQRRRLCYHAACGSSPQTLQHSAQHSLPKRCRIIIPRSRRHRPHRHSATVHPSPRRNCLKLALAAGTPSLPIDRTTPPPLPPRRVQLHSTNTAAQGATLTY